MALSISLNTKSATSITIDNAGRTTGTYDKIQYQYATRSDFSFTLAPIAEFATAASQALNDLNQANTYFIRARERASGSGAVGPWTPYLRVYTPISVAQDVTPLSIMVRPAIVVVPEDVAWSSNLANAAYPVDNLATDAPNEQFWTSSWSGHALDFDTAGQPIDTIALLGTNIPTGTTWTITSFTSAANRTAGTSVQYNSGAVKFQASDGLPGRPWYNGCMRLTTPRSEVFWRIVFSATSPPAGVLAAMFGVVGLARTAKNIAADKVETPADYGSLERTRDGIPDRRYGWRGRKVDFEIALMTEAQWETQFADLRHKVGLTDPVFVIPNTRTGSFYQDRFLYGPITASRGQQPYTPRFTHGFTIDSLI